MKNKISKVSKIFILLRKVGNVFYGIAFTLLILISVLVMFSAFKLPGNYQLFSVLSGSMEPKIKTGSIVFVKPTKSYQVGDIITVKDRQTPRTPVTHRIYSINEATSGASIETKGDANKTPDNIKRESGDILGKVYFSIPYFGFVSSFARTRDGLIFLVIVPVTIIVYSELLTIKNETIKLLKARRTRKLNVREKMEVGIGEEEIKAMYWFKRLWKKLFKE